MKNIVKRKVFVGLTAEAHAALIARTQTGVTQTKAINDALTASSLPRFNPYIAEMLATYARAHECSEAQAIEALLSEYAVLQAAQHEFAAVEQAADRAVREAKLRHAKHP